MNRRTVAVGLVVVVLAIVAGAFAVRGGPEGLAARFFNRAHTHKAGRAQKPARDYHIEIVRDRPDTIRFSSESLEALKIGMVVVQEAPPPEPLRLPGKVVIDPNRLIPVHSRFTGELVRIGTIRDGTEDRPLRYGDRIQKNDLIGVVW